MKIFVGNLSYTTTEEDLKTAFAAFGAVRNVSIIRDRQSGKSRGFGFVEMGADTEASSAIAGLNGKPLNGRTLTVNEARPRNDRFGGNEAREDSAGRRRRW